MATKRIKAKPKAKAKPKQTKAKPKAKAKPKPRTKPKPPPKKAAPTKKRPPKRARPKAAPTPATTEKDTTATIADMVERLAMMNMLAGNGHAPDREQFRQVMLRVFLWFSHDPAFDDLYDAATAALPVLAGYMMDLAMRGEDVASLNRVLNLLAVYLDEAALESPATTESSFVIRMGLHGIDEALDQRPTTILDISPVVREKQDAILARTDLSAALRTLLGAADGDKIRALHERFTDLSVAKNILYNIVRAAGEALLPVIEAHIFDLHPADQSFLLHGLDAFPKSKSVLAFYKRFLARNHYPSLVEEVKKYEKRVRSGTKTTGWET